jgi:hypothetical protein
MKGRINAGTVSVLSFVSAAFGVFLLNSCGDNVSQPPVVGDVAGEGRMIKPEKNFAYLINNFREGRAEPTPWAGAWWPYNANGIASGTYGSGASPAGKYDAARGGLTKAQAWEIKNHGSASGKVQGWWGHCNGWSAAAVMFPEPREPVKVNGITFGVADIKGLLTEAAMESSTDFFGNRVDFGQDYNSPKFWDTVPAQYFLVLTNYMGRLKRGVNLDRFTGDQVWNQPIAGYRFEYPKPQDYLGADASAPNVYRIMVTSTLWWARDDVPADVITGPFEFMMTNHFEERTLKAELWVDAPIVFDGAGKIQSSGDIVVTRVNDFVSGGAWRNGEGYSNDIHPDYMWIPYSVSKPTDYANPELDIEWIRAHILAGVDDPSVRPSAVPTAPSPSPIGMPSGWPTSQPTAEPTGPVVWPTVTPTVAPTVPPTERPAPRPFPTSG